MPRESMPLASGKRLGPYEILAPIGAGGMGEVYRGKDTRLDRTVAIKVLPSHLSNNAELRQRFEREARAVSSLAHPNICTLHDVGHQDGIDYLVMEFIDGESLADRLVKGPLPSDQVLRSAIEIAGALDKAHRAGIVHRDLKPGNIMLTKSGAKLLDFGLAKFQAETPDVASSLTSMPTERRALTGEGTILGTFQHMAPEQLEGKEADARTDIFALGTVLYEMATGNKAFTGQSQASLIGAILRDEPPAISTIQPMTPPALDRVVRTCLAKDPDERWQNAHDLMSELRWIAEGGSQAGVAAPVVARRKNRERLVWLVAASLFIASIILAIPYLRPAPADIHTTRLSLLPPEKGVLGNIAVSPDGRRITLVAASPEGRQLLWVRPLDSLAAQPLSGTDDADNPFWSPDGRAIGFFAEGKLKVVDLASGSVRTLADAALNRGGSWNRDGVILFVPTSTTGLHRVASAGGAVSQVTSLDPSRQEMSHRWPQFLPDGRHFLYLVRSPKAEGRGLYVGSLDSKETKRLLSDYSSAAYTPGYILFLRGGSVLTAQPFNPDSLQIGGEPVRIAEQVGYASSGGLAAFSISENGVLAYVSGGGDYQLLWFDRAGKALGAAAPPSYSLEISLSPDQRRVAASTNDPLTGTADITLLDLSRGNSSRLTFDSAHDIYPLWSPDGARIVFTSNRGGAYDLYQKLASGAGGDELLLKSDAPKLPCDWSRDGRFIIYETYSEETMSDLWILPLEGERTARPLLQSPSNERNGRLSPDGRWLAYNADESGKNEVYVQPFPPSGGKWQISTSGGTGPRWRADGRELYYVAADKKLMAVEVRAGNNFEAGVPKPLMQLRHDTGIDPANGYAVTKDGQRILVVSTIVEASPSPITVVLNWAAEVKR